MRFKQKYWANDRSFEDGTGLTNFDPVDAPIYREAVRRHGDPDLFIQEFPFGRYPMKGDYSLHTHTRKELGPFWRVFDAVAKEMGGTRIQKYLKSLK